MNGANVCSVCRQPNKNGGKHYSCATGKPRLTMTSVVNPVVVVRRDPTAEPGFLGRRNLAWRRLWQMLLSETEQSQPHPQTLARNCV